MLIGFEKRRKKMYGKKKKKENRVSKKVAILFRIMRNIFSSFVYSCFCFNLNNQNTQRKTKMKKTKQTTAVQSFKQLAKRIRFQRVISKRIIEAYILIKKNIYIYI